MSNGDLEGSVIPARRSCLREARSLLYSFPEKGAASAADDRERLWG